MLPIARLLPAPYNPRRISQRELTDLKRGVLKVGMIQAIVVNRRTAKNGFAEKQRGLVVVGGHQRLKVAAELKWRHVPCRVVELTERVERATNLMLNKIGGEFDPPRLGEALAWMRDHGDGEMALTGFDDQEAAAIIARLEAEATAPREFQTVDDDAPTDHRCPSCGYDWNGKCRP